MLLYNFGNKGAVLNSKKKKKKNPCQGNLEILPKHMEFGLLKLQVA